MLRVVFVPVRKFFLDSMTHLDPVFRRHGDIPAVEQRVNILSEQDAIANVVRPIFREWSNRRRLARVCQRKR